MCEWVIITWWKYDWFKLEDYSFQLFSSLMKARGRCDSDWPLVGWARVGKCLTFLEANGTSLQADMWVPVSHAFVPLLRAHASNNGLVVAPPGSQLFHSASDRKLALPWKRSMLWERKREVISSSPVYTTVPSFSRRLISAAEAPLCFCCQVFEYKQEIRCDQMKTTRLFVQ